MAEGKRTRVNGKPLGQRQRFLLLRYFEWQLEQAVVNVSAALRTLS
jgi:hypothetical protein